MSALRDEGTTEPSTEPDEFMDEFAEVLQLPADPTELLVADADELLADARSFLAEVGGRPAGTPGTAEPVAESAAGDDDAAGAPASRPARIAARFPGPAVQRARAQAYRLSASESSAIQALVAAMAAAGIYDAAHAERFLRLVRDVARELDADPKLLHDVTMLAMVHDIGKLGTPRALLEKRDPLTAEERHQLTRHPIVGGEMLTGMPPLAHLAYFHTTQHERWDGSGYPLSLSGEQIPLASRIVAVCDAYLAMVEDRPYRPGIPAEMATKIVEHNSGTQFCPHAGPALCAVARRAAESEQEAPEADAAPAPPAPRRAFVRVEHELERQLRGRDLADRAEPATPDLDLPWWSYIAVIALAFAVGVCLALPLPSAHHLCGPGTSSVGQCELSEIWLPTLVKVLIVPIGAVFALFGLSHLPAWKRGVARSRLARRPGNVPGKADLFGLLAGWGLAMNDAGIGQARTRSGAPVPAAAASETTPASPPSAPLAPAPKTGPGATVTPLPRRGAAAPGGLRGDRPAA